MENKKLSFETAVTKPLDARTYFWMNYLGSAAFQACRAT
jgi:hypothetical protein